MRPFFVAIIVVAIGYLGWIFYHESRNPALPSFVKKEAAPAPTAAPLVAPTAADRRPASPRPVAPSPPAARPGVFYALERITRQTEAGVKALNPGEEVRLMYRNKDGTMLVTNGRDEFVVKPSVLTLDREQARGAAPR